MTLSELAELWAVQAKKKKQMPSDYVELHYDRDEIEQDEIDTAVKRELVRLVTTRMRAFVRIPDTEKRERLTAARARARAVEIVRLREIELQGLDGTRKNLLDFTLADVESWVRRASKLAKGWGYRREWFEKARAALEETGSEMVGKLPREALVDLEHQAGRAW